MAVENLLGQTFNRLTAIGIAGRDCRGRPRWLWRCSCGNFTIEKAGNVKRKRGTKSCGCLKREGFRLRHGAHRKGQTTPEYRTWSGIRERCTNPNIRNYASYGGRGLTVCESWSLFENFLADMGPRPSAFHSIERIDNSKGYSPDNCTWATRSEQQRNKRNNRLLTFHDETRCVTEWAQRFNLTASRVFRRLNAGWSIERALTEPLRVRRTVGERS